MHANKQQWSRKVLCRSIERSLYSVSNAEIDISESTIWMLINRFTGYHEENCIFVFVCLFGTVSYFAKVVAGMGQDL